MHNLEILVIIPETKVKKKEKTLYINADEDHVSLQFHKNKCDFKTVKFDRKQNTIMPKLICVFEGIEKETQNIKRSKMINKNCFGGVHIRIMGLSGKNLETIVDTVYDEKYLEKIHIIGDGVPWVKTGLEVLGAKSIFVLDKFHLHQSIARATAHLGDSVFDVQTKIHDVVNMEEVE